MPFVNIRTATGLLDHARKAELQRRITDLMVEIEGAGNPAFRDLVWVLIEEYDPGSWCLGGTPVSPEMVTALRAPPKSSEEG